MLKRLWNWLWVTDVIVKNGIPFQIDGEVVGYLSVTSDMSGVANGEPYKCVWVPDRIINMVSLKKKDIMFSDIIEEDSKRLSDILNGYTPEEITAFEKLTEDSVIHGTAPFRLGCGPQRWYTKEGIQAQIDDWKRMNPDMNVGLFWYLSGIGKAAFQ